MIRVSGHVARKDGRICVKCDRAIRSGDAYRQLVAVGEYDIWSCGIVRNVAHESCVAGIEEWDLRLVEVHADPECAYVRDAYKLDVRKGSRVIADRRYGAVMGATNHVVVRLDGDRRPHYFHPSEIALAITGCATGAA